MLVLSRKEKEVIKIGEEITITLLRIDGNKVRIGIDAPKDIRVIRGELKEKVLPAADSTSSEMDSSDAGIPLSDREQAFAHPQQPAEKAPPKIIMGRVRRSDLSKPSRTPLADFMTAG